MGASSDKPLNTVSEPWDPDENSEALIRFLVRRVSEQAKQSRAALKALYRKYPDILVQDQEASEIWRERHAHLMRWIYDVAEMAKAREGAAGVAVDMGIEIIKMAVQVKAGLGLPIEPDAAMAVDLVLKVKEATESYFNQLVEEMKKAGLLSRSPDAVEHIDRIEPALPGAENRAWQFSMAVSEVTSTALTQVVQRPVSLSTAEAPPRLVDMLALTLAIKTLADEINFPLFSEKEIHAIWAGAQEHKGGDLADAVAPLDVADPEAIRRLAEGLRRVEAVGEPPRGKDNSLRG